MPDCEICGKKATKKARVDGLVLDVCDSCSELGEPVSVVAKKPKRKTRKPKELSKYIDPKYPQILKKKREEKGLKIKELAKKINEKKSVIARLERGNLQPSFRLAKKLEDFFDLELILEYKEEKVSSSGKTKELTIGDVAKIKE